MNTTPTPWTDAPLPPLPDLDAMARVADAGARLCERATIAGLDLVDGLVTLSSRQADVLLAGDGSIDSFWQVESQLVQVWRATLIECARECGDLMLITPPVPQSQERQTTDVPGTNESFQAEHPASASADSTTDQAESAALPETVPEVTGRAADSLLQAAAAPAPSAEAPADRKAGGSATAAPTKDGAIPVTASAQTTAGLTQAAQPPRGKSTRNR